MSGYPLVIGARDRNARPVSGAAVWVVVGDDLDRVIDPDDVDATETLIPVYSDRDLSDELTQPLTTDEEGQLVVFTEAVDAGDVFIPLDRVGPITPFSTGGGGVTSGIYQHTLATDIYLTSPAAITLDEGTFTPRSSTVIIEVRASVGIIEGAGMRAILNFLYGDPAYAPLNSEQQNVPNPHASSKLIGPVSASGTVSRRFKLTGLTPGHPVKFEITGGIVGYENFIQLPETPVYLSSSQRDPAPGGVGGFNWNLRDFFIAARGASKGMLIRSNHAVGDLRDELVATWDLPGITNSNNIKITPDGTKVVCPNYVENTITVFDVATLEVQGTYALPGGYTNPQTVAITPDSTKAYIACVGTSPGKILPMTIASGTFGTGWNAGNGPHNPAVSTDGTRLFVPRYFDGKMSSFDLPGGAFRAEVSYSGVAAAVLPIPTTSVPFGTTVAFLVAGTRIYAFHSDDTIAAPVNNTDWVGTATARLLSDGRTLLIGSNRADLPFQIYHVNIPGGTEFTRWSNQFGATKYAVTDMALTRNGSIFLPIANGLNVYYGGVATITPSQGAFLAEYLDVLVEGAD